MTAQLVMVVLMLGVEKAKVTYIAPLAVGLTLFMAEIGSVYYTGGSLNPARSFGPNVVMHSFPSYHWIYCPPLKKLLLTCRGWSLCGIPRGNRSVRLPQSVWLRKRQRHRRPG
jgi:Major intrinsic protein